MPTGYTAKIADGISFNEFVWDCARAFGALIEMRDSDSDAPIPVEFKPNDYYPTQLQQYEADLASLERMTETECGVAARNAFNEEAKSIRNYISKNAATAKQYEAMLALVRAWTPPSPDHQEMKSFMISQIEDSIKFDCSSTYYEDRAKALVVQSGAEWKSKREEQLRKDIAYSQKEYAKEVERVNSRNQWIRQLRESVPMPVKTGEK